MINVFDMKISDERTSVLRSIVMLALVVIGLLLSPDLQISALAEDRPVAVITGTFLVYVGHTVYLDGSESYAPGGGSISYQWKLIYNPQGSLAEIVDDGDSEASFTADEAGVYQVQLIVTSGLTNSKPAYATITCTNHPYFW